MQLHAIAECALCEPVAVNVRIYERVLIQNAVQVHAALYGGVVIAACGHEGPVNKHRVQTFSEEQQRPRAKRAIGGLLSSGAFLNAYVRGAHHFLRDGMFVF